MSLTDGTLLNSASFTLSNFPARFTDSFKVLNVKFLGIFNSMSYFLAEFAKVDLTNSPVQNTWLYSVNTTNSTLTPLSLPGNGIPLDKMLNIQTCFSSIHGVFYYVYFYSSPATMTVVIRISLQLDGTNVIDQLSLTGQVTISASCSFGFDGGLYFVYQDSNVRTPNLVRVIANGTFQWDPTIKSNNVDYGVGYSVALTGQALGLSSDFTDVVYIDGTGAKTLINSSSPLDQRPPITAFGYTFYRSADFKTIYAQMISNISKPPTSVRTSINSTGVLLFDIATPLDNILIHLCLQLPCVSQTFLFDEDGVLTPRQSFNLTLNGQVTGTNYYLFTDALVIFGQSANGSPVIAGFVKSSLYSNGQ